MLIQAQVAASDRVDHPTWVTPREEIADIFELSHVDAARDTLLGVAPDGSVVAMGWAIAASVATMTSCTPTCRARCTPTGAAAASAPS